MVSERAEVRPARIHPEIQPPPCPDTTSDITLPLQLSPVRGWFGADTIWPFFYSGKARDPGQVRAKAGPKRVCSPNREQQLGLRAQLPRVRGADDRTEEEIVALHSELFEISQNPRHQGDGLEFLGQ